MQKGQYIRLLLSTAANPSKVIAASKEMALHLSAQTEESSTKDTTGNAQEYDITAMSYDINGSALILTPDDTMGGNSAVTLADFEGWLQDQLLYWRICLMSGDHQRTIDQEICSGTAKLTNLQMTGQSKQNATYSYTLNGYGGITVPASQALSAPASEE